MVTRVLKFIRLPLFLLVLFAIGRFNLGLAGVPYTPRGNAMFSLVVLTLVSSFYFGAMSGRVGGLNWRGAFLVGLFIGLFAQALVFAATVISLVAHLNTYFVHWDALNVPEGTAVSLSRAMTARFGGLIVNSITAGIAALIGRVLSFLAPKPSAT
jgi:hypothetical protein